jgi:hypothetical protein
VGKVTEQNKAIIDANADKEIAKSAPTATVTNPPPVDLEKKFIEDIPKDDRPSGAQIPQLEAARLAPSDTVAALQGVVVSLVKDRIASAVKVINDDTKWDVLQGVFAQRILAAKANMMMLHPELTDISAVDAVLAQFSNGVRTVQDCSNILSIIGAGQWAHAENDVLILQSKQNVEKSGQMEPGEKQMWLQDAIKYTEQGIVTEAALRVKNGQGNLASMKALLEFGLKPWQIAKCQWDGGDLYIWWSQTPDVPNTFGFKKFNFAVSAGFDPVSYLPL